MKIAQINHTRVNNSYGGTEKVFVTLANALSKRGHDVACFYYETNNGKPSFKTEPQVKLVNCHSPFKLRLRRILAHLLSCFIFNKTKRKQYRNKAKQLNKNASILENIKSFNPDIVLIYWPNKIIYDILSQDIPVIQMIHMAPSFFKDFPCFIEAQKGIEQCSCIQVLMPEHVDELESFIKNKNIVHIPNIVPQYSLLSDRSTHTIVFIGRFSPQKRPWLIIESFALLKDKYPDWKVELWGETNFNTDVTNRMNELINTHKLEKQIIFCGTTLDIESVLRKASIIIMPSAHEGFGMALAEGMSMGLPAIVCKDCSALNSLVTHGRNGFLCDPTPNSIAQHMSQLMDSHDLRNRLGEQARKDMKIYSPDAVYKKWEALILKHAKPIQQ